MKRKNALQQQKSLMQAVLNGKTSVVRDLLDAGADPNFLNDDGDTPLHEAVLQGSLPIVRLLVTSGADPEALNDLNMSAMDIAREMDRDDMVRAMQQELIRSRRAQAAVEKEEKKAEEAEIRASGFRKETLKDVFDAQKWVGRTQEMQKHWDTVPKKLQNSFDFAAALTSARQATLKEGSAGQKFHIKPVQKPPPPKG